MEMYAFWLILHYQIRDTTSLEGQVSQRQQVMWIGKLLINGRLLPDPVLKQKLTNQPTKQLTN